GTLAVVNSGPTLGDLPTLWVHGQADTLVPLTGSTKGIAALDPRRLTTRIYAGARHEVFNEINRDQVLRDTVDFVVACAP
ncbi:MAG TPA: alpha/beta hydrolase, partial [Mycobacteriales bacterium]|nr:alpha/beta hydrolase [Mycobacteriales bacterium]